MNRRELLAATVSGSATLAAGCLGDGSSTAAIELTDNGAVPRDYAVDIGETVTWRNELPGIRPGETIRSEIIHEDADEWEFEETLSESGEEATHPFEEEGIYTRIGENWGEDCLCGVILVGNVSFDDPLPCSPVVGGGC